MFLANDPNYSFLKHLAESFSLSLHWFSCTLLTGITGGLIGEIIKLTIKSIFLKKGGLEHIQQEE
jgi:hypothetical protein